MTDHLTTDEAAAMLRLNTNTLRVARMQGTGPAYLKLGRRVFYRRSDLEEWMASRTRRNTAEPAQSLTPRRKREEL